jgi:hypothetical protein
MLVSGLGFGGNGGFMFRFQRRQWVWLWDSTVPAVGLMDGLGFAVDLDLGFEGGGLRWVSALMVGGLGLRRVSA